MSLLIPKKQWRIKSAWEDYWEDFANSDKESLYVDESYLPTTPLLGYGFAQEAFLAGLEEKRRILFLGNGISREPLDYYYSGFDVTVMDISEKAGEIFTQIANDVAKNVTSFLGNPLLSQINYRQSDSEHLTKSSQFLYKAGGSLEIVSADMFDWQPRSQWHYIDNKLAFLPFTKSDREFLLACYYSWLKNSGHLQIRYYSHKNHPVHEITAAAKEIGFLVKDDNWKDTWGKARVHRDNPSEYRKIWLEYDFQEQEKEILVTKGAKMLRVIWSSVL